MKKLVCLLVAVMALCLAASALAEGGSDAFVGSWICGEDDGHTLDIWCQDGAFSLLLMRFTEEDAFAVEFEKCSYDAEKNALICEGGALERQSLTEETETAAWETLASGFGAELTMDEEGLLHWTGSGDAVEDQVFTNWNTEDDGVFVGAWTCGDVWAVITRQAGVYSVFITRPLSDKETAYWIYDCAFDPNFSGLIGTGEKTVTSVDENGEMTDTVEYEDGRAAFYMHQDQLVWADTVGSDGEGLLFVRVADEAAE